MSTQKLIGEITAKSNKYKFYTLDVNEKQLSLRVEFDLLPVDVSFTNGDVVEFDAGINEDQFYFIRPICILSNKIIDELTFTHTNKKKVTALVYKKNSGGYDVAYKGYRCFLPLSESSCTYIPFTSDEEILNNEMEFFVKNVDDRRIILSRKEIDKQAKLQKRYNEIKLLTVGQSYLATIKQISYYGIFLMKRHSAGLLFTGDILGFDSDKINKKLQPEFADFLNTIFEIDQELIVTVKEIKKDNYSVICDKEDAFNMPFFEKINVLLNHDARFINIKEFLTGESLRGENSATF